MTLLIIMCFLLALGSAGMVNAIDNGLGLTPPMGWRSWNCFHADVNQTKIELIMEKMVDRKYKDHEGNFVSFLDLGYNNCGLDDNWQACGKGVDGSFHDADGKPLINKARFPDMKAMTDYAHKLRLNAGWYMNNCMCSEHEFKTDDTIAKHMKQSAAAVASYGFDSVKLDGCGQFVNLTWWAELLNATERPILIENCHGGLTIPGDKDGDGPCSGTTTPSNCPYNFFRTSIDIENNWGSMWHNLQTTTRYQDPVMPLSRPGTWAYPDMLEVGNLANVVEDRSHFGAWVITSSPLILSYNLLDDSLNDRVWDIVSNKEAIAINQAWAGHPGRLLQTKKSSTTGKDYLQIWNKKLAGNKVAVFVINNDDKSAHSAQINLASLDFTTKSTSVSVRDVWNHKDLADATGSTLATGDIAPHDSVLLILSGKSATAVF